MSETVYRTQGTCAKAIKIDLDGDIIENVEFAGGCDGNLKGISKLVRGRDKSEVIELLEGTRCGMKETSCPDQLAKALKSL